MLSKIKSFITSKKAKIEVIIAAIKALIAAIKS